MFANTKFETLFSYNNVYPFQLYDFKQKIAKGI